MNYARVSKYLHDRLTSRAPLDEFEVEAKEASRLAVEQFILDGWGERCEIKDTDDFPELKGHGQLDGRCAGCFMWEAFDDWADAQSDLIRKRYSDERDIQNHH